LGSAPFVLGKRIAKNSRTTHPPRATTASHSQHGNNLLSLKVTTMKKIAFILAAFVLFAPVAYAALYQAALIVA
jgi:hypothetical protein